MTPLVLLAGLATGYGLRMRRPLAWTLGLWLGFCLRAFSHFV
jgi:hypothetical protein